ncbi:MAG: TonB-dependent receptor plug domain-containing protein [Cyclobacteriaceae bacterium]|nr:TonB-dependent receptor plug domain-containing protein [Cyclobacteriaceae bacterium]
MTKKNIFYFSISAIVFLLSFVFYIQNDPLTTIIRQFNTYQSLHPQEKLYIHLDKPAYGAGETIWFKTYLVDALHYSLDSSLSKVVYVEFLTDQKKLVSRKMLYSPNGVAIGEFQLASSLQQGNYLIRAYTNFMRNYTDELMFYKEIPILSPDSLQTTASTPIQKIDLQFFPEGGNLLSGVENNVALKAIDSNGLGVEVEGEIYDEENKLVTALKTDFTGMGSFKLFPWTTKKYSVKINSPTEIKNKIALPEIVEQGYMMQVKDMGSNILVYIYCNRDKTKQIPAFNLVAQARGKICFAAKGEITSTTVSTLISKKKFPSGIVQITVFDGDGLPQCERLFYIQPENKVSVTITTPKSNFSKREQVELTLEAIDQSGKPVSGSFSLSVYDNELSMDHEKYALNIDNYLMLKSDLHGYIENPGYYFKDKNPETLKHLDLLMLTHGWRRFSWKQVMEDTEKPLNFMAEQGIPIQGQVLKSIGKKPSPNSTINILTSQGDMVVVKTDINGDFYSDKLVYFDSTKLAIQTENAKGKQAELQLLLEPFAPGPAVNYTFTPFTWFNANDFLTKVEKRNKVENAYTIDKDATLLKEVSVQATRLESPQKSKIYGTPTATVKMDEIKSANTYTNILQALQGRVAGVKVVGSPPNMQVTLARAYGTPLFLLNGTPVDIGVISDIQPPDVESIDVLTGASASAFGSRGMGGVIAVYTKSGGATPRKQTIGMQHTAYPGFYITREFYSPQYDLTNDRHNLPDYRSTLYWNPFIETDENGKAKVSFFTGDILSSFKVAVEGISYDGIPAHAQYNLSVQ